MVPPVDGNEGRERALRADKDEAIGGPDAEQLLQVFAAEDGVGGVGQDGVALEADAEPLAN